jgi:cbb3-type cytochrome oxidase subunit 3
MAHPILIVCGAVAAVIFILITASMFGVSRRAVEAEMRRAAEHDDADDERRDDLAA